MNPSTQPRISDVPDHTRDPRFNSRSKARCAVIKAILNVPDGTGLLARGKTTVRTRSSRLGSDGWCGPADEDTENGDDQDRGAQDQTAIKIADGLVTSIIPADGTRHLSRTGASSKPRRRTDQSPGRAIYPHRSNLSRSQ